MKPRDQYRIKDEYRDNPLSRTPGGDEVFVYYGNEIRVYDKVKNPKAYANAILERSDKEITKIEIKEKVLWEKS